MTVNPDEGTVEPDVTSILLEKRMARGNPPVEEEPVEADLESEEEELEVIQTDDEQVDSLDEDTEEFEEEEPLYSITVDGEEQMLTLDQLRSGHMMERDYRQKTSKLSEERKALEAEKERVEKYLSNEQQVVRELEILQELNAKPMYSEAQLVQIMEKDGTEAYLKAKAADEKRQNQLNEIRTRLEEKKSVVSEEQKRAHDALVVKEQQALKAAKPHLLEADGQSKLVEFLTNDFGFSADDINQTVDHRLFVMAEESRKYREIMSKSKKATKKAPKVTRTKARKDQSNLQDKKLQDLKRKAAKSGNKKDIQNLLLEKRKSRRK